METCISDTGSLKQRLLLVVVTTRASGLPFGWVNMKPSASSHQTVLAASHSLSWISWCMVSNSKSRPVANEVPARLHRVVVRLHQTRQRQPHPDAEMTARACTPKTSPPARSSLSSRLRRLLSASPVNQPTPIAALGDHHLNVRTAAIEQNGGRPELVSLNLAKFASTT